MATVTAYTAARSKQIEDTTVINGRLTGDDLILIKRNLEEINVGSVRGPRGYPALMRGTSTTSRTIGTGSHVFTINPAMDVPFAVGSIVRIAGASAANYMVGQVTASTATSVTVNVTEVGGSGTFASWTITLGAYKGIDGVAAPHKHNASDIDAGTLPVSRGGTGGTTAAEARTALEIPSDPAAGVAGMRTLGAGAQQAAAGNHVHLATSAVMTATQVNTIGGDLQSNNLAFVTNGDVGTPGVTITAGKNGFILPAGVWLVNAEGKHSMNQNGRTYMVLHEGGPPGGGSTGYRIVDLPGAGLGNTLTKTYVIKSGTFSLYPCFARDTASTFTWNIICTYLGRAT